MILVIVVVELVIVILLVLALIVGMIVELQEIMCQLAGRQRTSRQPQACQCLIISDRRQVSDERASAK